MTSVEDKNSSNQQLVWQKRSSRLNLTITIAAATVAATTTIRYGGFRWPFQ